ncbi:MAG TPA: hypothetical protein VL172_13050 [Kofleriaceae bacterium]|nr:hypothetical protein [Kofleriaceae bacterium]
MRNPWKLTTLLLALVLAAIVGVQLVPGAIAQTSQPRMKAALAATQSAIRQLEKAAPNKEGHRVKAIGLLRDAEKEIQAGIAAGE